MAKILEIGLSLPELLNQDTWDLSVTPTGRDWRLVFLDTVMKSEYRRQWNFQLVSTEFLHDDFPEIYFELEAKVDAGRTVISTRQIVEGPSGLRFSPAEIGGLEIVSSAPDFHAELDFFKASYMKHEGWISETIKLADESSIQELLDDAKNIMLDELAGLRLELEIRPTEREKFRFAQLALDWLGNRKIGARGEVHVVDNLMSGIYLLVLPISLGSLVRAEAFELSVNSALENMGSGKKFTLEKLSEYLEINFVMEIDRTRAGFVIEWQLKDADFETSLKSIAFLKCLLDEDQGLFAVMSQDFAHFADQVAGEIMKPLKDHF